MRVCDWKPTWQESKSSCESDPIGIASSRSKSKSRWPTRIGSLPTEWLIDWLLSTQNILRVGCSGFQFECAPRNCSERSRIVGIFCRLIVTAIGPVFFLAKATGGCSVLKLPRNASRKQSEFIRTGQPQGSVRFLKNQTSPERIPGLISPLGITQPSDQATQGTVTREIAKGSVCCCHRLRAISSE